MQKLTEEQKWLNGERLDHIGYITLNTLFNDATPYKITPGARAGKDCSNAREYYKSIAPNGVDVSAYRMHHTQDGTIVPVSTALHESLSHYGGCKLFGIKR